MPSNLKNRLKRIRELKKDAAADLNAAAADPTPAVNQTAVAGPAGVSLFFAAKTGLYPDSEWINAGYLVLKRKVKTSLPFDVPQKFPQAMKILIRDFLKYGVVPDPADLVFFDLETTGLSGGAGTLAFICSFGRFRPDCLVTDQYLLLDYPGEGDFLEAVKAELLRSGNSGAPAMAVSYNGKTFDSQILKNRFLMNAIACPDYFHADLLHPSRRLWKHILPDCSQATIETAILGLDRSGDIPGALAPDIWFDFLKTGVTKNLTGVCDHNIRDITGLASILLLLANITSEPIKTLDYNKYDLEALALLWRDSIIFRGAVYGEAEKETSVMLMDEASRRLAPRALYVHGLDLLKSARNRDRGASLLEKLASVGADAPADLKASALCALAKNAEWSLRDLKNALVYTDTALARDGLKESLKNELEKRRERLVKKMGVGSREWGVGSGDGN
ncbi:MAG: ribonuclease H-like domain-containing protein [Treponema sp.]|nr:ribonuclease H-like domain-containing protein [Treponema sp.]